MLLCDKKEGITRLSVRDNSIALFNVRPFFANKLCRFRDQKQCWRRGEMEGGVQQMRMQRTCMAIECPEHETHCCTGLVWNGRLFIATGKALRSDKWPGLYLDLSEWDM